MAESRQTGASVSDAPRKAKDAGWLFFLLVGGGFLILCTLALYGSK